MNEHDLFDEMRQKERERDTEEGLKLYLEDPLEEMEGKCGFDKKKPEIIRS